MFLPTELTHVLLINFFSVRYIALKIKLQSYSDKLIINKTTILFSLLLTLGISNCALAQDNLLDGIANSADLNDDSDGIIDCNEGGLTPSSFQKLINSTCTKGALSNSSRLVYRLWLTSNAPDIRGSAFSYNRISLQENFTMKLNIL